MRERIGAAAALVLLVWSVGTARADGLGPRGYQALAGVGISIILGGLLLSVAVILAGFFLVLGPRRRPRGVWRKIGLLALSAFAIAVGGSILTFLIVQP
jgi:hypothetical protein